MAHRGGAKHCSVWCRAVWRGVMCGVACVLLTGTVPLKVCTGVCPADGRRTPRERLLEENAVVGACVRRSSLANELEHF